MNVSDEFVQLSEIDISVADVTSFGNLNLKKKDLIFISCCFCFINSSPSLYLFLTVYQ